MSWNPDPHHRARLTVALQQAATTLNVTLVGNPLYGWQDRTICCHARANSKDYWLRVLYVRPEKAGNNVWQGNETAAVVSGVAKPTLLRVHEWDTQWDEPMRMRAELSTYVSAKPCSSTFELRQTIELPDSWWSTLRKSLETLAVFPTDRVADRQDLITRRLTALFGDRIDPTVRTWTTAHGDLHWANLTEPECYLLDWEGWGLAPAGFDAAHLYCCTLLQPELAQRVHQTFADWLDSADGALAQLFVVAELLIVIERGGPSDLAEPLRRHADQVLSMAGHR